jgi:hypothetical protein
MPTTFLQHEFYGFYVSVGARLPQQFAFDVEVQTRRCFHKVRALIVHFRTTEDLARDVESSTSTSAE